MREVDQELFDAVEQGNLSKVQECLERGANVDAENNYGKTPLDLAREEGYGRIVNILGGVKPKVMERESSNVYFGSEKVQELDGKYSGDELESAKKGIAEYLEYRRHVHLRLVRGKDRGMSAWHYVLVDPDKKEMFLEKSKTGSIDVADYGEILYSGWGQDPPQNIKDKIEELFDKKIFNDLFLIKEEHKNKSLYHYVLVDPDKKEMFLEQFKTDSALAREIENYGRVLYSGWGQDPPESISDRIERAYSCTSERDLEGEFANLSVKDSNALRDAARNGELETVRYVIRKGVNVNSADKNGWTSLHHAAYGSSSRVVKYLINNGANIYAEDTVCGRKPIHVAAREGNTGIVRLFLSKGIGVNDADKNSWTPLHYAVWNGHLGTVKLLINEGADIHAKDDTCGKKPVHIAAEKGRTSIIELFISGGISIDDTDKEGRTLLYYAAWKGRLETVKFLAGKGANIHTENTYGIKPIHVTALSGHENILEFFFNRGLSVNEPDKDNWTPLHCAASEGKLEAARFLIKEGADINAKNNDGKTPLDHARKRRHMEVVDMLDSVKKKSRLLETTGDNPELYLGGITISSQSMRARAPGN